VEASVVRLNSALWYLKQRGLAASDDKSSLQITVDGMDFLESRRPLPEQVMPFIKPAAVAISQTHPQQVHPLQAQPLQTPSETPARNKHEGESVMATLDRALAEIRK
jgi:hypothetical protein